MLLYPIQFVNINYPKSLTFNNHKSSLRKYGQGIRHMAGEHLYAHFFGEEHEGLADLRVIIIDKTNMNDPTQREAFWAYNLDTFAPKGLNLFLKVVIVLPT